MTAASFRVALVLAGLTAGSVVTAADPATLRLLLPNKRATLSMKGDLKYLGEVIPNPNQRPGPRDDVVGVTGWGAKELQFTTRPLAAGKEHDVELVLEYTETLTVATTPLGQPPKMIQVTRRMRVPVRVAMEGGKTYELDFRQEKPAPKVVPPK